jgi:hypothetical protein
MIIINFDLMEAVETVVLTVVDQYSYLHLLLTVSPSLSVPSLLLKIAASKVFMTIEWTH